MVFGLQLELMHLVNTALKEETDTRYKSTLTSKARTCKIRLFNNQSKGNSNLPSSKIPCHTLLETPCS